MKKATVLRKMRSSTLLAALAGLLLTGCHTQSLFIPNAHQTPLFVEKGEVHVSGMVGSGGAQGTIGWAPASGLALVASGTFQQYEKGDQFHDQAFGELAVGFFDSYNDPLISEFYLGYGMGKASFMDYDFNFQNIQNDTLIQENNFSRLYLQYNIGLTSRYFDGGLSFRVSHVSFPGYFFKADPERDVVVNMFTGEPVVFLSAGYKNFRIDAQAGLPLIFSDESDSKLQGGVFSVGLRYIIGRQWIDDEN